MWPGGVPPDGDCAGTPAGSPQVVRCSCTVLASPTWAPCREIPFITGAGRLPEARLTKPPGEPLGLQREGAASSSFRHWRLAPPRPTSWACGGGDRGDLGNRPSGTPSPYAGDSLRAPALSALRNRCFYRNHPCRRTARITIRRMSLCTSRHWPSRLSWMSSLSSQPP